MLYQISYIGFKISNIIYQISNIVYKISYILYKISYNLNKISDIIYKTSYILPHIRYGHLTRKSGVLGSIPGLATYFRCSFRFFKKGSCQLLAKVCARSTG